MAQKQTSTSDLNSDLLTILPDPPFMLSETASQVYFENGQKLIALEMLKASDILILAQYATEAATYIHCTEQTATEPLVVELHNKVTAPNPYRKLAETAFKNMLALSDRLGLSPASRHRLKGYKAFRNANSY